MPPYGLCKVHALSSAYMKERSSAAFMSSINFPHPLPPPQCQIHQTAYSNDPAVCQEFSTRETSGGCLLCMAHGSWAQYNSQLHPRAHCSPHQHWRRRDTLVKLCMSTNGVAAFNKVRALLDKSIEGWPLWSPTFVAVRTSTMALEALHHLRASL